MNELGKLLRQATESSARVYNTRCNVISIQTDTQTITVEPLNANGYPDVKNHISGIKLAADLNNVNETVTFPVVGSDVIVGWLNHDEGVVVNFSNIDYITNITKNNITNIVKSNNTNNTATVQKPDSIQIATIDTSKFSWEEFIKKNNAGAVFEEVMDWMGIKITKDGVVMNNGTSPMVLIEKLVDRLNTIENAYNDLQLRFNKHTHVVKTTGSATAQAGTSSPTAMVSTTTLSSTIVDDIKNPKILQ